MITREKVIEVLVCLLFSFSILRQFFKFFLSRFDGHAFPKSLYHNFFLYACAVVRANAPSPLGFFELLLGLFFNKLVFLFVRTAADLVANQADGATGEYNKTSIDQACKSRRHSVYLVSPLSCFCLWGRNFYANIGPFFWFFHAYLYVKYC